jgi:hypothetical protein
MACAARLRRARARVTLVDRYNYHLFQPLLYQVATAILSRTSFPGPLSIRHCWSRELFVSRSGTITFFKVLIGQVGMRSTKFES